MSSGQQADITYFFAVGRMVAKRDARGFVAIIMDGSVTTVSTSTSTCTGVTTGNAGMMALAACSSLQPL